MKRVNLYKFLQKMRVISEPAHYSWSNTWTKYHVKKMYEEALALYRQTEVILDELDQLGDFATVWPAIRVWVPLQLRLCAEQVMWDRGGRWRRYVSGFRPVEGEHRESLTGADKSALDQIDAAEAAGVISQRDAQLAKRRIVGVRKAAIRTKY